MSRSLSGWSFFGLSSEYRQVMLDEFYHLTKQVGFSYSDILLMPTFERKYFIDKLVKEVEKKNEMLSKKGN